MFRVSDFEVQVSSFGDLGFGSQVSSFLLSFGDWGARNLVREGVELVKAEALQHLVVRERPVRVFLFKKN